MEYGKFNSAEELLKGYNELEKSFTQKCQQLAALQKQNETCGTNENPSPQKTEDNDAAAAVQVDCAVPTDADAASVANDSPTPPPTPLPKVMASGGNVSLVLPIKPKTIKEASALAKKLFEK